MDSGGNMQSNEERIAEKLMDNYLKSQGFHRKKIAKDGSCLFRAVAEQVLHCQSLHTEVRAKCVEFLKKNRDSYEAFIEGDFEEYLYKLQDPQQWVGEVEINALAVMYKRDFLIYQEPGKPAVNITDNNFKDKVRLCFLNGNHYDSVYPLESIKSAAICQSILYELLYEGVFKVDRNSLGSCQRTSRASDLLSDDCMNVCMSSDESDLETDEPLWVENGTASSSSRPSNHSYRGRGRGRLLPERVRRSLNPTLLRNVDYDIWHKTKRAQQKIDYSIAAGMQFSAGDRCQVRQEKGHSYKATIKDVPADNGLVTVYIEELGEKKVPLWYLRPINEENSWTTVTNRDKRLSNGHGEWESRGRGRGRGKTIGASSSSVSPATGVGSTGRMQKQHSWPPQATAEEQGGGKSNRKSLSSTEPCFGLTEEERLAKKKEKEKNAALVEIQLKDEESFPALGSQSEFGRKKLGDKRRTQRNKMRSPVDEVRAPSPTAGDRPKSSTPPPAAPPVNVTSHTNSALPAAKPAANFDPTGPSSLNVNMAAATISAPASVLPPNIVTAESKPSTQSYASAAAVPVSPPPGIKPPAPSSASLFSFITPVLPAASAPAPPSSSSSAASPPPQALAAAPTFIAPIAPSPTGAQGFKRPFSPLTSLPRPPSPSSSSSTIIPPPVQVKEALPAPTHALPKIEGSLSAYQTSQSETSASQNLPQVVPNQVKASVSPPEITTQHSLQEIQTDSFPPNQIQAPQHQLQAHAEEDPEPQTLLPPQSESTPVQSPHPPPELPQVLQSPSIQSSEEPLPPKSDSPPSDPQHSHPPPPVSAPQIHPHLPHPQSIPGTVPLQQLTQLYQDPLYPGFPQGEKGEAVQGVSFSTTKSGDDLPKDINVLRFFFNLGVKAYSTAMYPPCVYLFPLQQYYTMQLKPPSHAPSPTYACPSPPAKPQEAYQPGPPYPPASASPQFNHQTPPAEPPRHTEPSFNPNLYQGVTQPPPQRMPCTSLPWQQVPPPRNPSCPVAYPSPPPPYSNPSPSSQGYHPGQAPVHSLYPSAAPPYPHFPIRYQPSSAPEELQVNQGAMEQLPPGNADPIHSHGHVRVLGPMETPPAANMVNPNNNRGNMLPANYAFNRTFSPSALKKEPGEVLTRTVLLVDPPLNNKPILAVVSDPDMSDASLRSSSNPGSPSGYRGPRKHFPSTKPYPAPSAPDHSHMVYTAAGLGMAEPLSVACSTEDDFDVDPFGYQGQRRVYRGRGGRGRSSYDPGRGMQRRRHGDQGAVTQYYSSSFRGRGRAY